MTDPSPPAQVPDHETPSVLAARNSLLRKAHHIESHENGTTASTTIEYQLITDVDLDYLVGVVRADERAAAEAKSTALMRHFLARGTNDTDGIPPKWHGDP